MSLSKEQVERELSACSTLKELSSKLSLSYNATRSLLKEYDLPSYPRGQRRRNESNREFKLSKEDIIRYYCEQHLSLRQIAKIAGVSFQAVHGWLIAYQIPMRKRGLSKPLSQPNKQ